MLIDSTDILIETASLESHNHSSIQELETLQTSLRQVRRRQIMPSILHGGSSELKWE